MNNFPSSRPGYSLIFAFLIMTVMLIVAGTAIQNTNEKLVLYNELGGSSEAYLAAQSAAESGIMAIQDTDGDGTDDYSPGYETSQSEAFCWDSDSDGECNTWGNFVIVAKQREYNGYFYSPIFGTGTAGNTEDCNVTDYIDPSDGTVSAATIDVDDPCHWNKLLVGESVSIPLFDTDSNGNKLFPVDLSGFNTWELRVRTPCSDGTNDSDCTRYILDETNDSSSVVGGDSIVFWQLTGLDNTGTEVSLIPDDSFGTCGFSQCRNSSMVSNTEIYEDKINTTSSSDFVALSSSTTSINDVTFLTNLSSLYLQLDIVHALEEVSTLESIPYLEWQLVVDSGEPLADTKSLSLASGYFQGNSNIFFNAYTISRSTTGESSSVYTLSN